MIDFLKALLASVWHLLIFSGLFSLILYGAYAGWAWYLRLDGIGVWQPGYPAFVGAAFILSFLWQTGRILHALANFHAQKLGERIEYWLM